MDYNHGKREKMEKAGKGEMAMGKRRNCQMEKIKKM
jgi:hypothetical protein